MIRTPGFWKPGFGERVIFFTRPQDKDDTSMVAMTWKACQNVARRSKPLAPKTRVCHTWVCVPPEDRGRGGGGDALSRRISVEGDVSLGREILYTTTSWKQFQRLQVCQN